MSAVNLRWPKLLLRDWDMLITSYDQVEELVENGELTTAEKKLLDACRTGKLVRVGNGQLPNERTEENAVRAGLLRYLMCGGCEAFRPHDRGVELEGAWIEGELNLEFVETAGNNALIFCYFSNKINALQMTGDFLNFGGSRFPGLIAQGAKISGSVLLREAKSEEEISLSGAEIGGNLECTKANLNGGNRKALSVEGAKVSGTIHLNDVVSNGEISFSGIMIGGGLDCRNIDINAGGEIALNAQNAKVSGSVFLGKARLNGGVFFSGIEIKGQFECSDAILNGKNVSALNGQRMVVKGSLFWRDVKSVNGKIDLTSGYVGDLVDDKESWDNVDELVLSGFTYDNLHGSTDLTFRKDWLRKGAIQTCEFHPQPYQQLAKVLRASGHRAEALDILVEKEIQQRRAARRAAPEHWNGRLFICRDYSWDWLSWAIAAYGYKPWRSLVWLLAIIGVFGVLAHQTWQAGDFAPNSDVILTSENWKSYADAVNEDGAPTYANPAEVWSKTPDHGAIGHGRDYETFDSLFYAMDVVVPIINLGQTEAWAHRPPVVKWASGCFIYKRSSSFSDGSSPPSPPQQLPASSGTMTRFEARRLCHSVFRLRLGGLMEGSRSGSPIKSGMTIEAGARPRQNAQAVIPDKQSAIRDPLNGQASRIGRLVRSHPLPLVGRARVGVMRVFSSGQWSMFRAPYPHP